MKIHCLVLCILSPLLSSCTDSSASSTAANPFMNVSYEVVAQGLQAGITNQQLHVVTDDAELAALAARAVFSPTIPALDLTAKNVVAIFTGLAGDCSGLAVVNVSESADILLVEIEKTFHSDRACVAVIPNNGPYILVTTPKTGKPVSFAFAVKIV